MNQSFVDGLSKYSYPVLRIGLAAVVLWFGLNEVINAPSWFSYVPEWAGVLGLSTGAIVYLNGTVEIILAALLILGFFPRLISFILFLHLLLIVSDIGITPIGVRDLGLAAGFLSLSLYKK